jgi:hypothetical protein
MVELKIKKGKLTTAELATYGILPIRPVRPKLVKANKRKTLDQVVTVSGPIIPLLSESSTSR